MDDLLEDPIGDKTLITLARVYGLGAKVPREAISKLIEAFRIGLDEVVLANRLEPRYEVMVRMAIDELQQQLEEYKEEERKKTPPETCPDCGWKLKKIYQPEDSLLNADQWEASKRGDLRCEKCKKFYFFANGELWAGHND